MAPKTKLNAESTPEGSVVLNATQVKILQHIANNPRTTLQVDREDLAHFAGYRSSGSAAAAWHDLRKKLGIVLEKDRATAGTTSTASKKARKIAPPQTPTTRSAKGKKRALSMSPDDDDDELQSQQPMAKRARRVAVTVAISDASDNDTDAAMTADMGAESDETEEIKSAPFMSVRAKRGRADLKKVAAEQSQVDKTAELTEAEMDLGSVSEGESELTELESDVE